MGSSKETIQDIIKSFSNLIFPMEDQSLIALKKVQKVTSGGIYLPDTIKDLKFLKIGTVVALGPGRTLDSGKGRKEVLFNVGDDVLFSERALMELGDDMEVVLSNLKIKTEGFEIGIVNVGSIILRLGKVDENSGNRS